MRRREIVQFLGAALALSFVPRDVEAAIKFAEDLHLRLGDVPFRTLNRDQRLLVTTISEMIIPETDTLGATTAKVPEFIDLIATDWMSDDERAAFLAGLSDIDARSATAASPLFVDLPAPKKVELLTALDGARKDKAGAGLAFARIKALTVYGYFTSKRVEQEILKVQMFFNGYQGNVPFTPAV
jgi:gluconate 2-dehydrogenase gamma chain